MSDGLLLNLNLDSGPVQTSVNNSHTGGRWKDRRRARNASKYAAAAGSKIKINSEDHSAVEASGVGKLVAKDVRKRRADHSDNRLNHKKPRSALKEHTVSGEHVLKQTLHSKHPKETGDTFVSSLFTSNPSTETVSSDKVIVGEASNAPLKDISNFSELGINQMLVSHLQTKMKMLQPTRIQKSVIPTLIGNDIDIFVNAQTGSGKTLAYLLPILERVTRNKTKIDRSSGLFALILAPTRELSNQIYSVLDGLVRSCHWIVPGIVTGGEKKKSEKARIRKGINILVATPGRLADHFDNTESLDLSQIRWVVLDEGDRLMEMGFEETISKILSRLESQSRISETKHKYPSLPSRRVNILCSATIKDDVKKLGELSLSNAEFITADSGDSDSNINQPYTVPAQLLQEVSIVPAKLRLVTLAAKLMTLAQQQTATRTIVFFSCTDSLDFFFSVFTRGGKTTDTKQHKLEDDEEDTNTAYTVMSAPLISETAVIHKLHGSLNQQVRTSTLAAFSKRDSVGAGSSILFCTDVASRGLDLPEISNIIEFDPPFALEDHLHRIGRTARAGHSGSSLLFLLPGNEEGYLEVMNKGHSGRVQTASHQELLKKGFGSAWEVDATTWHLNVERWLLEDEIALSLARKGFTSHIRAYATHLSKEREIFNMKSLHLGHIAKSFALREVPGKLGGSQSGSKKAKGPKKTTGKEKFFKVAAVHSQMSEFNIGV
jgi:ATP-dependent RNA helicase DDX31/DBP7